MRITVNIDERLLVDAMKAGSLRTRGEAIEAGLRILARQAAYREILQSEGRLKWEGENDIDWTAPRGAGRSK